MSTENKRKALLGRLSRNLMVTVPMMTVVAVAGAGFNAGASSGFGLIPSAEAAQARQKVRPGEKRKGKPVVKLKVQARPGQKVKPKERQRVRQKEKRRGKVPLQTSKAVRRPDGYQPYQGNVAELRALGEKLFNDNSLSSNGLSCATCHANGAGYNATFKNEYPHMVAMGQRDFGLDMVHLDEMVQICMVAPMAADPLAWGSKELAALTEYSRVEQKKFIDKK